MTKITYLNEIPVVEKEARQPERLPPVSYHAKAAILIGLFVFLVVIVAGLIFGVAWLLVLKGSLLLGMLAAAAFGVYWIAAGTTYDWRMDKAERRRRWQVEDEARWSAQTEQTPYSTPSHGEKLDRLARLILERHFLDRLQATREACEAAGLCTQDEWNIVNAIMKEIGIKGANSFNALNYATALGLWREKVRVEPDVIMVRIGPDSWKRVNL